VLRLAQATAHLDAVTGIEEGLRVGLNRTVAAIFGVVYLVVGVAGFFLSSPLFGQFEVNTLHNIVHVVLGAILIWGMMNTASAVLANRWVGVVLLVLGVLGFFVPDGFGLVPLGGNDIWLHLASGVVLFGVSLMGGRETATV
jgi:hypothetical protein